MDNNHWRNKSPKSIIRLFGEYIYYIRILVWIR